MQEDMPWSGSLEATAKHEFHNNMESLQFDHNIFQPPSTEGKMHFIGCSEWLKTEWSEHLYAPIPSIVDETILFQLMNGQCIESPDLIRYGTGCSTFLHHHHRKQKYCSQ